jgi:ribosome-associated protein YbcJ (S4-like RNA binding protein)
MVSPRRNNNQPKINGESEERKKMKIMAKWRSKWRNRRRSVKREENEIK